jgi:hypothetical protein
MSWAGRRAVHKGQVPFLAAVSWLVPLAWAVAAGGGACCRESRAVTARKAQPSKAPSHRLTVGCAPRLQGRARWACLGLVYSSRTP